MINGIPHVKQTITSKQSVELKSGMWSSQEITSERYIPYNASTMYRRYINSLMAQENSASIFEALYFFNGGMQPKDYNRLIKNLNEHGSILEDMLKVQSYTLIVLDRENPSAPLTAELFDDYETLNLYCVDKLGVSADDIKNRTDKVPARFKGSTIQKQRWHCSPDKRINNLAYHGLLDPSLGNLQKLEEEDLNDK